MKKLQIATSDFVKAADALTNESFNGGIHIAIAEGLAKMDPFIGDHAPVFFVYTFYGHLYSAQMHANKLFDKHSNAVTVEKFLEMARMKKSKFQHAGEQDVLACIAEAQKVTASLAPAIKVLRERRNDFLAHLSPKLAFTPEVLQAASKLTMPQIDKVLHEGGKIVNRFLQMWNNSANQLRETHNDDYKKIVSLVSKQLCAEIQAHEAEFNRHGLSPRPPGPRDCP